MPKQGGFSTRRLALGLLPLLVVATGCSGEFDGVPYEELQRRAMRMPLKERYDFYLLVTSESRPPKTPKLAEEVAALGEPAWKYAIERASNGTATDVDQALPVMDVFERRCTDAEYAALMKVAVTEIPSLRAILVDSLKYTCHRDGRETGARDARPDREDRPERNTKIGAAEATASRY